MTRRRPQVGDWADHNTVELDPRQVTRVEKIGNRWFVGLDILGSTEAWPCPASNYRFTPPKDQPQIQHLRELGYISPRLLDEDHWAGLSRMIFTTAILTGEIAEFEVGYSDRWCYDSFEPALAALNAWDGTGEPTGWHRHPKSGRRVARTGKEIDEHGNLVPIGQIYVYH